MLNFKTNFLFVKALRGIKYINLSQSPKYEFTYSEVDIPNTTIYGIFFDGHNFVIGERAVYYDYEEKRLNLDLEMDKKKYAPGQEAILKVKVKDQKGRLVKNSKLAITILDNALLKLKTLNPTPLTDLYNYVGSGVLFQNTSLTDERGIMPGMGAEMGGDEGLDNDVRKNFKDNALWKVVDTDANGYAEIRFKVPDNITSWKVFAVDISNDLGAGVGKIELPVTKDVFVDAVVPKDLLLDDKPVIKLRSFGSLLPKTGTIEYEVNIPSLGVDHQKVSGEVNKPVYLAIDKLIPGDHKAIIRVKAGKYNDAIEKTINIVKSRISVLKMAKVELGPGVKFKDIGLTKYQTNVLFQTKNKASLYYKTYYLAHRDLARVESIVASNVAQGLLEKYYSAKKREINTSKLALYQKFDGGISLLPYASSDPEVASDIAFVAPDLFDKSNLINYFWDVVDNPEVSREESIRALSALAALHQPVLMRLNTALKEKDLSWSEKVVLAKGLAIAGDQKRANLLLDDLLKNKTELDDIIRPNISQDKHEEAKVTVQLAGLSAMLDRLETEGLMNYANSLWDNEYVSDLDRALYLKFVLPRLSSKDIHLKYMVNGQTKEIDFKGKKSCESVDFLLSDLKSFQVVSVDGPVVATYLYEDNNLPESSDLLSVTRSKNVFDSSFNKKEIQDLNEGDFVRVTLHVNWAERAPEGCYMLKDNFSAGTRPMTTVSWNPYGSSWKDFGWYAFDLDEHSITYVVCKNEDRKEDVTYTLRVTQKGSYVYPQAILQSIRYPAISAYSAKEVLNIK